MKVGILYKGNAKSWEGSTGLEFSLDKYFNVHIFYSKCSKCIQLLCSEGVRVQSTSNSRLILGFVLKQTGCQENLESWGLISKQFPVYCIPKYRNIKPDRYYPSSKNRYIHKKKK